MQSEQRICENCKKNFLILEREMEFLKRKDIPFPTECFKCRQDKRLAMRNERNLYKRKCDKCHQDMIGTYAPDSPYVIYCQKCFWEFVG